MTKTEQARYNKLMEMAVYFGVKVIYPPLAGSYEDVRDKKLIEKERAKYVQELIEQKLPKVRTRIVKPKEIPKAKRKR